MASLLVFGAACLDYIAQVSHFPAPDEKLRTDSLTICGGGNAGNTATCLSRLGIPLKLLAKIGSDSNGEKILQEFREAKNIDISLVLMQTSTITPMTYTIVDRTSQTRTCLFSATNEQILTDEIQAHCLNQIRFIHFDSRSTEAAVHLAKLAKEKSIRCSLDLERERPHLNQLIPLMDYIITTERYSYHVCHDPSSIDTAKRLLQTCQWVIITSGKNGSMLVERRANNSYSPIKNIAEHGSRVTQEIVRTGEEELIVWKCTAWPIQSGDIVDTTGSGDAFIGATIYGLLEKEHWRRDQLLRFASYVAMCKLNGVGARSTLPHLADIDMRLFD